MKQHKNIKPVIIVGAGPAGVILSYLLARKGIPVTLIEAQKDFEREFRGDTLHPSVMENLEELGLVKDILKLPHTTVDQAAGRVNGKDVTFASLKELKTKYPYITVMPQAKFLEFMTKKAKKFPSFKLIMGKKVTKLQKSRGKVRGVELDDGTKITGQLVVGCDGRFSAVRTLANIPIKKTAAPMDVMWFKLPKKKSDPQQHSLTGHLTPGNLLAQIDRGDYWQMGGIVPKGAFQSFHQQGIKSFQDRIIKLIPQYEKRIRQLTEWKQVSTFIIECGRVHQWHQPGLLLIGDAAHIMSPVGGVGINYAIQDAIVAANVIAPAITNGKLQQQHLAEIQRRRIWPTRVVQWFQSFAHRAIIKQALRPDKPLQAPWIVTFQWVRKLLARFIAFGLWRVHVK